MYLNGCKIGRAYVGACALDGVYRGECSVIGAGPAEPTLLLDAFTYDPSTFQIMDKAVGVGDVDTLRTAVINVPDMDGVYKEIPSGQIAYPGARTIPYVGLNSEDFEDPAWVATAELKFNQPDPHGGLKAVNLIFSAAYQSIKHLIGALYAGDTGTMQLYAKAVSGNPRVVIWDNNTGFGQIVLELTEEWQLFANPTTQEDNKSGEFKISVLNFDFIGEVSIAFPCYAVTDGPMEYAVTQDDGITVRYANANGNTMDVNNIVTEGTGALLDPIPYALVAPAATNHILGSKDVSRSPWLQGSVSYGDDYDGIDGSIGTVRELLDSDATSAANYQQIPAFPYNIANTRFYIRRNNSNNQRSYFRLRFYGTLNQDYAFYFRSDTGVITPASGVGTTLVTLEDIGGVDWWKVSARQVDTNSNSGYWVQMYPADLTPESTGSLIVGQVDVFNYRTLEQVHAMPPIYTTSVTAFRDKDAIALDSANLLQASGTISFELDQPANTANSGVISTFLGRGSGIYRFTDGVSAVDSGVLSGEMRIGLVWGDGIMDMAIDGAWIGEQPYDGSLPDGVLDLFRDSAYTEKIRNLKIWNSADKSLIS